MTIATQTIHQFTGVRLQIDSPLAFDEYCVDSTTKQANRLSRSSMK